MAPEDMHTLLAVARWTTTHRNRRCTIRELAGTEENYLLFVQELDRVESQRFQTRRLHAEATLTLLEWLEALAYFQWRCAYCGEKPFQVMSHYLPLAQAGTTVLNCLPACYHCRNAQGKTNERIQKYFAQVRSAREWVVL
jgi:hypothetical protein